MDVELTARQVKIPKALRAQVEEGMNRIARILGRTTTASITFRTQRHLQIAELTVKARMQTIAACGEADTQESALRAALAHAEHQALRHRDRNITRKRLPKEEKVLEAPPVSKPKVARATSSEAARGKRARQAPRGDRGAFLPRVGDRRRASHPQERRGHRACGP